MDTTVLIIPRLMLTLSSWCNKFAMSVSLIYGMSMSVQNSVTSSVALCLFAIT